MSPSQPRPRPEDELASEARPASGVVAIVGRPNVGKSALFNRLMGQRVAIVEDVPGTTRDRLYGTVEWRGRAFTVVDTGGIEEPTRDELRAAVRAQAEAAIAEADVLILVVDAASGLIGVDEDVADLLRRSGKPLLLVANKAESERRAAAATEFYALGLGDPIAVSALHGTGSGDLLDAIVAALPEREESSVEADARIAIVGRPNVGKSSLLNAVAGRERAVVAAAPGTTRDPVDTLVALGAQRVLLVDTAGLRRRGKIESRGVEAFATLRTVRAVDRADVAILLIDATEGVTAQDLHVAGYVLEAFKGLVIGVNKWDAVERGPDTTDRVRGELRRAFHFIPWAPEVFVSAKSGHNVAALLDAALAAAAERRKRVDASELRRFLVDAVGRHPPSVDSGAPLRFTHVLQSELPEPVFIFFVNRPDAVHFSYERYLENELRRRFSFPGTPIRLVFKGGGERS